MAKRKTEVEKIKKLMMDALEIPNEKGHLMGDYVCHEDIPDDVPGFDTHFTICGEQESPVYLVVIKRINL